MIQILSVFEPELMKNYTSEYICILNTATENFIRKVNAQNEQEAKDKFIEYLNEEIDEYYFGHEDKDYVICKELNDVEEI